jgi:hypothetical protein
MNELITTGAVSVVGAVSTMDAVSILEIEIFEGVPLWLIGLLLSVSLVFTLLIMLIFWVSHAKKEVKQQTHHAPSSQEVMIELQKELLRSMEETSRHNRFMILLTILFILVSVVGGAVVLNFFQNISDFGATWIAQFINYLNSILTK